MTLTLWDIQTAILEWLINEVYRIILRQKYRYFLSDLRNL